METCNAGVLVATIQTGIVSYFYAKAFFVTLRAPHRELFNLWPGIFYCTELISPCNLSHTKLPTMSNCLSGCSLTPVPWRLPFHVYAPHWIFRAHTSHVCANFSFPDNKQLKNWRKVTKRSSVVVSDDQYEFHLPSHKADQFFEGNLIIPKKGQYCNLNPLLIFHTYLDSREANFPL